MVMLPQGKENQTAHQRFRESLAAFFRTGTWNTPETRRYIAAERHLDEMVELRRAERDVDEQWEYTKAELDALIDADRNDDPSVRWHYDLDR